MSSVGNNKDKPLASLLHPQGITAMCFNKDHTKVCYATASNELVVASVVGNEASKWTTEFTSRMHDMTVAAIDWVDSSPTRIVSCGHDRVAYVYTQNKDNTFTPEMVTLAVPSNRGALCTSWSSSGLRFVVGTSTSSPSVCIKDHENNWWNSKALKGHTGAVTCAAYCPSEDALLATGSTDGTVRIVSTALKDIDAKATLDRLGKFGTELCALPLSGVWLNGLAWNPSGTLLAAVTHDSTLHVLARVPDTNEFAMFPQLRLRTLVPRCVAFVGERTIVTAGADRHPVAYVVDDDCVKTVGRWSAERKGTPTKSSAVQSAMSRFQNEAALGGQTAKVDTGALRHLTDITHVCPIKVSDSTFSFVTTAMDGRAELWTAGEMERDSK
eukprot:PhM_4_TR6249/c0_g1_i1/m.86702/K05757/ARPC1A_B; actin related protein 2/3 complex, subunit 1A/1B